MLTSHGAKFIWDPPLSPQVTSYLISYTTAAEYTSGGSTIVNNQSTSCTITHLEEDTEYIVTVQAMINNLGSFNNPEVKISTYTDGKLFMVVLCH